MLDHKNNTSSNESLTIQPIKKIRHLIINENIVLALLPFALKLYMIFRYESDYRQDCSSVNRKIKFFMERAGISRSKVFECLNELEDAGLIKRESKAGEQTKYWIADNLYHFTPDKQSSPPETPPVQNMDDPVQNMDDPVQNMDTINNNSFSNISNTTSRSINFEQYKKDEVSALDKLSDEFKKQQMELRFREESIADEKCQRIFKERFAGLNVTIDELYEECRDYWSQKNQMVYKARFESHLKRTPLSKYQDYEKKCESKRISPADNLVINEYVSLCKAKRQPTAEIKEEINEIKSRLCKMDSAIAREALSSIRNAEEALDSVGFSNLIKEAGNKSIGLSRAAKSSLSSIKDCLR